MKFAKKNKNKKILILLGILTFSFSQNFNNLEDMIFKNPKFIEFDKNCTNGDSWFCSEVGMTYYKYKNENKAIEYFTKVCKNNSCINLAKLYDLGYETNKSVQKATEFYTKSYKIGDI